MTVCVEKRRMMDTYIRVLTFSAKCQETVDREQRFGVNAWGGDAFRTR